MKKFIAMLLIVVMVCCMFSITAFARDPIISPEQGTIEVIPPQDPTPGTPGTPDTPITPDVPSSPQTGGMNIGVFMVAVVLLGGVAVVTMRKVIA